MDFIIYIKTFEFFLLPFYVLFFFWVARGIVRKYYSGTAMGRYFYLGLGAKIFGSIVFALMSQYFFKEGDTFLYFSGGLDFKKAVFSDFPSGIYHFFEDAEDFNQFYKQAFSNQSNFGYVGKSANLFTAKVSGVLSVFSFNGYLLTSLFFGLIAYSGLWRLFLFFSKKMQVLTNQFAICLLLLPSLLYWGGGIMKDTLCLGAIGWFFSSFVIFFIERKFEIKHLLIALLAIYVLFVVKTYIAISILIVMILWFAFSYISNIKNHLSRRLIYFAVFFISVLLFYINYSYIVDSILEGIADTIKEAQEVYARIGGEGLDLSNFGEITPTVPGLLSKLPLAINNALFRPYIWESKKLSMLLSAIENFMLMLLTVYVLIKPGVITVIKLIFKNQVIAVCFCFSMLFAMTIGSTCFNAGSLVRYKIPLLPFYSCMLIMLYNYKKLNVNPKK